MTPKTSCWIAAPVCPSCSKTGKNKTIWKQSLGEAWPSWYLGLGLHNWKTVISVVLRDLVYGTLFQQPQETNANLNCVPTLTGSSACKAPPQSASLPPHRSLLKCHLAERPRPTAPPRLAVPASPFLGPFFKFVVSNCTWHYIVYLLFIVCLAF